MTTVAKRGRAAQRRLVYSCSRCSAETDAVPDTVRAKKSLCRDCFGKKEDLRPKELNDLSGKEWAAYSRSVEQYPDVRSEKQRDHGACFPLSLAKQQIEIFTKERDMVLDPFVGVGTTLDAAKTLNRRGIGFDINRRFTAVARRGLVGKRDDFVVKTADCRTLSQHVESDSVDFILTSPPYGNLLKNIRGNFAFKWKEHSKIDSVKNPKPYSEIVGDLGNVGYGDFLVAIIEVMKQCKAVLRNDKYMAWVVKDFRALKSNVPFVNFHGDIITCAQAAGFTLWDIRIYDQTKFRPLVCLGYPSQNFYLNIGHSYILVFRNR